MRLLKQLLHQEDYAICSVLLFWDDTKDFDDFCVKLFFSFHFGGEHKNVFKIIPFDPYMQFSSFQKSMLREHAMSG